MARQPDINRVFQTELRLYRVNGIERMSVSSDPMIPRAFAPVIKAIRGLYTIEEHTAHHFEVKQLASPELTISSGTNFITPEDFQTIYDGIVSR